MLSICKSCVACTVLFGFQITIIITDNNKVICINIDRFGYIFIYNIIISVSCGHEEPGIVSFTIILCYCTIDVNIRFSEKEALRQHLAYSYAEHHIVWRFPNSQCVKLFSSVQLVNNSAGSEVTHYYTRNINVYRITTRSIQGSEQFLLITTTGEPPSKTTFRVPIILNFTFLNLDLKYV